MRNAIEGKFGQGKRRFSLNRVMAKLPHTTATTMAITVLVMNLERWLRPLVLFFVQITHRYFTKEIGRLRSRRVAHWRVAMGDRALV